MNGKTKYTEEQKEWLRKNWCAKETCEKTTKRFNELFGTNYHHRVLRQQANKIGCKKPKIKYKEILKEEEWEEWYWKNRNNANPKRKEWERVNGTIPKGYTLTDLGNGEMMLMEKNIYRSLQDFGAIGQGEYTKVMHDIIVAKRKLEKQTGKIIYFKQRKHTKEEMDRIRALAIKKNKKLKAEDVPIIKSLYKSMSSIEIAKIYGVSDSTIMNCINGKIKY